MSKAKNPTRAKDKDTVRKEIIAATAIPTLAVKLPTPPRLMTEAERKNTTLRTMFTRKEDVLKEVSMN